MLHKFDGIGRGTMLFDDFRHCCMTVGDLTTAFRQTDTDQDGVVTLNYEQLSGGLVRSGKCSSYYFRVK